MNDLFAPPKGGREGDGYSAKDIEVLEGLEPVRRRPGMYVGGTDEDRLPPPGVRDSWTMRWTRRWRAMPASSPCLSRPVTGSVVQDNGRGIPVDPHPKFKNLSALEVILTTLHSGGKFGGKAYETSGGLHGVGSSVVNALSESMQVEVARDRTLYPAALRPRQAGHEAGEPGTGA